MDMQMAAMEEKIKVVIRPRGLTHSERTRLSGAGQAECWKINDQNSISLLDAEGKITAGGTHYFDKIFSTESETADVYKETSEEIIKNSIEGFNGTIFAYGQTSSGKTYTMSGEEGAPGIIPMAVKQLFDMIGEREEREYLVRVSYVEIYNEIINDLLNPESTNLKVMDDIDRGVYVADLQEEVALSPEHVMSIMKLGQVHRSVGATNMNEKSSRSHTIFRMMVESRARPGTAAADDDGAVRVSCLNLVDLAGSERAKSTGAEGQRLKEGCHINKSLLTLGQVITKLSDGDGAHVPYRDSKLTRLLQPALGGNSRTAVICTITLSHSHAEETLSTLKFAGRAKDVTNSASINEVVDDATMMKRLQKEILVLKKQMSEGGMVVAAPSPGNAKMVETLKAENQTLEKKLEKLQHFFGDVAKPNRAKPPPKFRHSVAPSSMSTSMSLSSSSHGGSMLDLMVHKRKISSLDSPPAKRATGNSLSSSAHSFSTVPSLSSGASSGDADAKLKKENEQLKKQVQFMEEELDRMESDKSANTGTGGPGGYTESNEIAIQTEICTGVQEEKLRVERVRLLEVALAKAESAARDMGPKTREMEDLKNRLKRAMDAERKANVKIGDLTAADKDRKRMMDDLRGEVATLKADAIAKEKEWKVKEKEARIEKAQIKVETATLEKQNKLLQRQVDKASSTKENKKMDATIKELEGLVEEARAEVPPAVAVELESVKAELADLTERSEQVVGELESAVTERDSLVMEKKEIVSKLTLALNSTTVAEEEKNKIFEQMIEVNFKQEEERARWEEGKKEMDAKLAKLSADLKQKEESMGADEEMEELEAEIMRMANEAEKQNAAIAELKRERHEAEQAMREAQSNQGVAGAGGADGIESAGKIHGLKQDLDDQRALNERQDSAITRLEAELKSAKRRLGNMGGDGGAGGLELIEAKADAARLKKDLNRLQAHAQVVMDENARLAVLASGGKAGEDVAARGGLRKGLGNAGGLAPKAMTPRATKNENVVLNL